MKALDGADPVLLGSHDSLQTRLRINRQPRTDPWRYRLENEDDEYRDRGELPPPRDLPWMK